MYYRPTNIFINLDNIVHNFEKVCRLAGHGTPVAPVIKSDAYGHGCIKVALKLLRAGADRFAVSLTEEALEIRNAGIDVPILVLGGVYPAQTREIVTRELTPVISTFAMANALQETAQSLRCQVKIHIKVETGLGRLGIPVEEVLPFVYHLKRKPFLSMEGICTSYSSIENRDFTETQFHNFERIASEAMAAYGKPLLCHIANTGGLLFGFTRPGWLIRPGIILYGSTRGIKVPGADLKPAIIWRTEVFKVQKYPAGHAIGYGGIYKTRDESRIALLPVGYSDGLLRSYMGKGEVLINGRRAPLVGRPSMDWATVETGNIPAVLPGDEVILLGEQGGENITVDEMAQRAGTNVDEVLISIGKRIPRIYQNTDMNT